MTATVDAGDLDPTATGPTATVGPFDVAVIITCHDYGAYVGDAVRSALAQDQVRAQVIVVDDGSTDDSPQVLAAIARSHPGRVEVLAQANLGQAAAMNAGFARADAPVVLFLDADDVLHPRTAARCVDALAEPGAARVQFPMRVVDRDGAPTGRTVPDDPQRLPVGDVRDAVLRHPDDLAWQPTSGNAFSAVALARILPMPEPPYRTCADHYLSNLTALLGAVVVLDGAGADYRVHGANADHRDHLDVGRLRTVIGHTVATHGELERLARDLGHEFPADPLTVPSVTFFVNRLVSLRLAPDRHPLPGDRRLRLVLDGARAARRRQDLPRSRRLAMAAWFVGMGAAPRRAARRLAERALLGPGRVAEPDAPPEPAASPAGGARTDWRFLLPVPVPELTAGAARAVIVGAPPRTTAPALFDLGLVSVVDRVGADATASIGAVVGGEPPDLGALAAVLAPGGHAWIEVDRRRRGGLGRTPGRLARQARAAGLTVTATYLVGPSLDQPRRFIPLDHPGALAWYLRTQVVAGAWVPWLGLVALRTAVAVGGTRLLGPLAPSFGVVVQRTGGGVAVGPAGPAAVEAAGGAGDDLTRSILLTSGQDRASRAVLLPFVSRSRRPASVVKVASVPSFGRDTSAEQERLAELALRLPASLAATIPRATATSARNRLVVGVQSATAGRPLEVRVRSVAATARRTIGDLDAATAWLVSLHAATRSPTAAMVVGGRPWRELVVDPLDRLRREVLAAEVWRGGALLADLDRVEERSLAAIAGRCGAPLPVVERHHDFVPCNVLRERGGVSVVDWEIPPGREAVGPALVDLLLFVTFWYGAAHRSSSPAEDLAWLGRLLDAEIDARDDRFHGAAWRAIGRYCAALGIDPAVTPLALAVLWLERHDAGATRARRLHQRPLPATDAPIAGQLAALARRWGPVGGPWIGI